MILFVSVNYCVIINDFHDSIQDYNNYYYYSH